MSPGSPGAGRPEGDIQSALAAGRVGDENAEHEAIAEKANSLAPPGEHLFGDLGGAKAVREPAARGFVEIGAVIEGPDPQPGALPVEEEPALVFGAGSREGGGLAVRIAEGQGERCEDVVKDAPRVAGGTGRGQFALETKKTLVERGLLAPGGEEFPLTKRSFQAREHKRLGQGGPEEGAVGEVEGQKGFFAGKRGDKAGRLPGARSGLPGPEGQDIFPANGARFRMQYKSFAPHIEVLGLSIQFIVESFAVMPSVGVKYLARYGMGTILPDGKLQFDPHAWYSLDRWLLLLEGISTEVGSGPLFAIGRKVGTNAPLPPSTQDIRATFGELDRTYHAFHRREGKVMLDPATGLMLEGIGHYRSHPATGQNRIEVVCENPYPCDFDMGIVTGFSQRFQAAIIRHEATAPCRKRGAESCTYVVTW